MPHRQGIECIREIRNLAPGVPVIAISGGVGGQADYLRMAGLLGTAAVRTRRLVEGPKGVVQKMK